MAVHDVGGYRNGPPKPGQVFSIDPQLRVPSENLYLRFEDTIVVTETGYENFTDFIPIELADLRSWCSSRASCSACRSPPKGTAPGTRQ